MLFSSTLFLLYFLPAFLTIYFLLPSKAKNPFTLFASILFFAWGAPKFVFILSGAVVFDFFIAQAINKREGRARKIFLAIAVLFNAGLLLYFKYFNFFLDNINVLLNDFGHPTIEFVRVVLPIGISFFVFHELSYVIDVYRRVKPPMTNLVNYALYIFLFPQLIAGPIIRFHEIADQIQDRKYQDTLDNRILGIYRFAIGLAKKVLVANVLGEEVDRIFSIQITELDTTTAWIGALSYTFQIYFDFSGYSDMAIGLARAMGFIFPENFNHPYISQNITEFWRRWHMSLSRWMKDYLYISLGGNKGSVAKTYFNLCLVFLISGFWHGAEWTFIFWGAYHGTFLILDRIILNKWLAPIGAWPRRALTFFVVVIGWIFFRAESMGQAMDYLEHMFNLQFKSVELSNRSLFIFILAAILSFVLPFLSKLELPKNKIDIPVGTRTSIIMLLGVLIIMIICVGEISSGGFNPFIYFKF